MTLDTTPSPFDFKWSSRREGNSGFVLEECSRVGHSIEFGPLPPHIVPAFIDGRRRIIQGLIEHLGGTPAVSLEDYEFMRELRNTKTGGAT